MIKPITKEVFFQNKKSIKATIKDKNIANDLLDTLTANSQSCVGMAANMIGINKRIIAINVGGGMMIMYNPVIVSKSTPYNTEEGCLSLSGTRQTLRYKEIVVEYDDKNFKHKKQKFTGWIAQIIQHECDHLEGIII